MTKTLLKMKAQLKKKRVKQRTISIISEPSQKQMRIKYKRTRYKQRV